MVHAVGGTLGLCGGITVPLSGIILRILLHGRLLAIACWGLALLKRPVRQRLAVLWCGHGIVAAGGRLVCRICRSLWWIRSYGIIIRLVKPGTDVGVADPFIVLVTVFGELQSAVINPLCGIVFRSIGIGYGFIRNRGIEVSGIHGLGFLVHFLRRLGLLERSMLPLGRVDAIRR